MIYIKKGVRLHGIRSEIVLALMIVNEVYSELGHEVIVTSVIDGKHMRASIHYTGGAIDIRAPKQKPETYTQRIAEALGDDFDVVLENGHIHIEWQPKEAY